MKLVFFLCLAVCYTASGQHTDAFVASTEAHLEKLAETDQFSGIVLVARQGKPLFKKAYGFANLSDSIPNRVDTKFNLASMGKMFTAVAIMQLVEAGKLTLHDKVGKILPDYPNKAARDSVTIHQLLSHTSGLGNFWEAHSKQAKERFRAVSDYLPLFADEPLLFTPGKQFAYSNSGFTVLGLIIEKITGRSYFDYVKEKIFTPSGMKDTDAYELDLAVPRLAIGYTRSVENPGHWKNNTYVNVIKGGPAGGSYSTADDLLRFSNALLENKLLSKENTKILTTRPVGSLSKYAYGFSEEIINTHRVIGHSGGHIGIANEMMIFTDLGYTTIILTNGDVGNFWDVDNFMRKHLVGSTPDIDNYYFTKAAVELVTEKGYDAGVRSVKSNPGRKLKYGLAEQTGYDLLWAGKHNQAIDIFKLNVFAYPEQSGAYLGLGQAYRLAGNLKQAIEHYKKYVAMEPDDVDAVGKLKKLIIDSTK